jgi:putative membrane protein
MERNDKQSAAGVGTRRDLLRGLAAGAVGGFFGAGVKLVGEVIAPPRTEDREPPPGIAVSKVFEAIRGRGLTPKEMERAAMGVHWSFSVLVSAVYGGVAELFPWVTAGYGTAYGVALWAATHESALPLLGLTPPLNQVPASEQITEFVSHGVYGASVELTRRIVRRRIFPDPAARAADPSTGAP